MRTCGYCGASIEGTHGRRLFCCERCRKRRYGGVCIECGASTTGTSGGYDRTPERCWPCASAAIRKASKQRAKRRTQEAVELRKRGLNNVEIAKRVGSTPASIGNLFYHAHRYGIDPGSSPHFKEAA